jgi:hypothetical protein
MATEIVLIYFQRRSYEGFIVNIKQSVAILGEYSTHSIALGNQWADQVETNNSDTKFS